MSLMFRPARRSEARPLIGIYGRSKSGKTYGSLLLARGFVGPTGKVGMIETESGRGEVYADMLPGGYLVLPIRDDFGPRAYAEAITAAEKEKLDALIIDSGSHEWEGTGGVLDMATKNLSEGKKSMLAWQQPKMDHQRFFMLRLMQTPIPLVVLCMRAKYPMVEKPKSGGGKEWVRSDQLEPQQSEDILYEMQTHGWLDQDHKLHVSYGRPDLKDVVRDGEPITIEAGERLAQWAKGAPTAEAPKTAAKTVSGAAPASNPGPAVALLSPSAAAPKEMWRDYLKKARAQMSATPTFAALDAWFALNIIGLDALQEWPDLAEWFVKETAKHRATLPPPADQKEDPPL